MAWGSPFQTAAHPIKERNHRLNNGLKTYREQKSELSPESGPSIGPLCPALLFPPSTLSRPPPLTAFLPPSLSLALCLFLPSNSGTLSLPLSLFLAFYLFSLSLVLTVCTSILLPLSSLSWFLFLWSSQYILTLLYPASPRPAEVGSQREGPGIRVPLFLLFWAPTHCPDRHLLGLPLLRWR